MMDEFLPSLGGFLGIPDYGLSPLQSRCLFLPVPYEQTSSYGQGSASGPSAILEASHQVEFFDAALGFEPHSVCGGIATLRPLTLQGAQDDGEVLEGLLHETVARWLDKDKFVLTLGGEHTSVVGAIRAHCERFDDVTVLQLDAHSDLRESYDDMPWSHACAMARVLDFHTRLVQVGIRSQCREERQRSESLGIPVFYGEALQAASGRGEDWIQSIIDATSSRVYVTLDCDVLEPYWMPATGTPEPGGLTWSQLAELLQRLCAQREVVGLDVNELAPVPTQHFPQYMVAKLLYRFLGYRFGMK